MYSVAIAQVHLQYFLPSQITHNKVLHNNNDNDNICVYININLFKQNKLHKDHWQINRRAFNWNLNNVVPLHTSYSSKRNKWKHYKETKFPWQYKSDMQSLFTDNTILCLYPGAAMWSKNVLSLKKVCH